MRGFLIGLLLLTFAWGVIDESLVDPGLVEESIETNCPADPTFGGQCRLASSRILEPSECREIDGVRFCRDWWKKEFVYECNGDLSIDELISAAEGLDYCDYKRECAQWEEIPKKGGTVSCRTYYDKNRPGCYENPYQSQCIADDCGDLFERCELLDQISYSDIPDPANMSVSGVSVSVYTFSCPSDVRKVCRKWKITKVCPDGTTTVCNTVSSCKKYETRTVKEYEPGACLIDRPFKTYTVIKNSPEAIRLRSDPLCIKITEEAEIKDTVGIFSWGWDGDYGDSCCAFLGSCSCESYVTGLSIMDPDSKGKWLKGSQKCYKVSGKSKVFPEGRQLVEFFEDYIKGTLKLPYSVVSVNLPAKREISTNPHDTACFGDSDDGNRYYRIPISLQVTYETYKCFSDKLDKEKIYSSCNINPSCVFVSSVDNLETLECYAFELDYEDVTKSVCSKYNIMYRCPYENKTSRCVEWETKTVCNDGDVTIPALTLEGKDFSQDFGKAVGMAQALNEIKHIWTGEPQICESGWWSPVAEDPAKYFISKAVSYVISKFGPAVADAAKEFFQNASACINPALADAGVDGVKECMAQVAESSYSDGNSFLSMVCGGSPVFCGASSFLVNPAVAFAISVAWDIISSFDKCNSCTAEDCANRHNDYREYVLISKGLCRYVGSKCSWEIKLGLAKVCMRVAYKHCCYDSKFARILVEQAYKQLGYDFGNYYKPNCSALTLNDIKKLDFSKMDFSELIAEIEAKMQIKISEDEIRQKIEEFFGGKVQPTGETPWGTEQ